MISTFNKEGWIYMFSIEELTLLNLYRGSNRLGIIDKIEDNYKYQDNDGIILLIDNLINKFDDLPIKSLK